MKLTILISYFICCLIFLPETYAQKHNQLTTKEKKDGFVQLFNGTSTQGWRGYNQKQITSNWSVQEGSLVADGTKGDIVTEQQYGDFVLTLEYKISEGGNSGVFFHVVEGAAFEQVWHTGIEMQVMDNKHNPSGADPITSASSLYAMYAPVKDATKPAGEWNKAVIKVKNAQVAYWLNNELVNQYTLWDEKWYADRENCIHNNTRKPGWGEYRKGHIALQDEGFKVWYRNISIKPLD